MPKNVEGCYTCRIRRKKCEPPKDLSQPCNNCNQLNYVCQGGFGKTFATRPELRNKQYRTNFVAEAKIHKKNRRRTPLNFNDITSDPIHPLRGTNVATPSQHLFEQSLLFVPSQGHGHSRSSSVLSTGTSASEMSASSAEVDVDFGDRIGFPFNNVHAPQPCQYPYSQGMGNSPGVIGYGVSPSTQTPYENMDSRPVVDGDHQNTLFQRTMQGPVPTINYPDYISLPSAPPYNHNQWQYNTTPISRASEHVAGGPSFSSELPGAPFVTDVEASVPRGAQTADLYRQRPQAQYHYGASSSNMGNYNVVIPSHPEPQRYATNVQPGHSNFVPSQTSSSNVSGIVFTNCPPSELNVSVKAEQDETDDLYLQPKNK